MAGSPEPNLAARLRDSATRRFGPCQLDELRQLPGGHSGLTWRAELTGADGERRTLVVKSTPEGRPPVGRHDVLRQSRAITALAAWGRIPVPQVYFADAGTPPFFAMEHVAGDSSEPILDGLLPDESASTVAQLWEQAIATLATRAGAEPASLGLGSEPAQAPSEELGRWRATAGAAGEEFATRSLGLAEALARSAPAPGPAALTHGDYRLGNMLRRAGAIRAVIDWEIWSIGDSRCDLGWLTLLTDPAAFPGLGRPVPGTPTGQQLIDEFGRLRHAPVERMAWFVALSCFKMAAVQAHNLRRHREGRRHDPYLEGFQATIERLLVLGSETLSAGDH
jgi:aminoglycoside phosphotransferase (APT) family kinase protein